jgi:hypothetical protein
MKMKALLPILLLAVLGVSCASHKEVEKNMDTIQITPDRDTYELTVGQKIYYAGTVHGSVGIQKECNSADEAVLKLIDKDFKYAKPLVEGETGGDRATETYTFEAASEGKTTVTIEDWYRGDLESTRKINIHVSNTP